MPSVSPIRPNTGPEGRSSNRTMNTNKAIATVRQSATNLLAGLGALLAVLILCATAYVQVFAQNQGAPAPLVPQTFLDANGDPLASGTVSTYVTATGTSAVT